MTFAEKLKGKSDEFVSNPLAFVADPFQFNQRLLRGRVTQYHKAAKLNFPFVFYDRGIPDVLAYMDYFKQEFDEEFSIACKENKYDRVILLPPWEAIYKSDNERMESFEEAREIHEHLNNTYTKYGYDPIFIPEGTVEERTTHILKALNDLND